MTFDIDEVMRMYYKAKKENDENRLWEQWLVSFRGMDKDHFTSYEDYKKKLLPQTINNVESNNKDDIKRILEEAEKIKILDQRGGNK